MTKAPDLHNEGMSKDSIRASILGIIKTPGAPQQQKRFMSGLHQMSTALPEELCLTELQTKYVVSQVHILLRALTPSKGRILTNHLRDQGIILQLIANYALINSLTKGLAVSKPEGGMPVKNG